MMCGGRKEGMGSRPRLHGDRLYAGMPGGIGGMGSRGILQAGGEIPRGTRNDMGGGALRSE